jgi:uncharacterized protein (DUF1800 family)
VSSDLLEAWRPEHDGPWDRSAALHLLSRAGLGPTQAEVERALREGPQATLAALLTGAPHERELFQGAEHVLSAGGIEPLAAWWMALMLGGADPLGERLTLMWHGHFATSNDKVGDPRLMWRQNLLLRERARGDFRELLRAMARDVAMLIWLDGDDNKAGHPNENFARELLELFALGLGHYGEHDVLELARALTGWGTRGRRFEARPEHHDRGVKSFLGRTGIFDVEAALEIVLGHPACPEHVAGRLLREFVGAPADENVRRELARALVGSGWRIDAALRLLLSSKLFYSAAARRSRIAGPVELVVRAVRLLGAQVAPDRAAKAAARMGQALFRPPTVKGWDGGRQWIDPGTYLARHNFLVGLLGLGEGKAAVHPGALWSLVGGEQTARNEWAPRLARSLLGSEQALDEQVSNEWSRSIERHPGSEGALLDAAALLVSSPDFQLT